MSNALMKRAALRFDLATIVALAMLAASAGQVEAGVVQLLTNGNFETGNFAGWQVQDLAGSSGTWFIDNPGTPTPLSGNPTIGSAANGNFYAVVDQTGGGTHALFQQFTVPVNVISLTLSFNMFVNDWDTGPIVSAAGLNHTAGANQHARVDILTASAPTFSTTTGLVSNHYLGVDAGADPHAFASYSFNLTGLTAGTTYRLRFGETDNQSYLNMGVDNVSILAQTADAATVPEPASLALFGLPLVGMAIRSARRRRTLS